MDGRNLTGFGVGDQNRHRVRVGMKVFFVSVWVVGT